jgi:hypothetical protein
MRVLQLRSSLARKLLIQVLPRPAKRLALLFGLFAQAFGVRAGSFREQSIVELVTIAGNLRQ